MARKVASVSFRPRRDVGSMRGARSSILGSMRWAVQVRRAAITMRNHVHHFGSGVYRYCTLRPPPCARWPGTPRSWLAGHFLWVLVWAGACYTGTAWAGLCLIHHHHHSYCTREWTRSKELRRGMDLRTRHACMYSHHIPNKPPPMTRLGFVHFDRIHSH